MHLSKFTIAVAILALFLLLGCPKKNSFEYDEKHSPPTPALLKGYKATPVSLKDDEENFDDFTGFMGFIGKAVLKEGLHIESSEEKKIDQLIKDMAQVEDQLRKNLEQLAEVKNIIERIYTQMTEDNFFLQSLFLNATVRQVDTVYQQLVGIIGDKPISLKEILTDPIRVKLFEAFYNDKLLREITDKTNTLSGRGSASDSENNSIHSLFVSHKKYLNTIVPIRGEKTQDLIPEIDNGNEALLSMVYDFVYTQQKSYILQRIALLLTVHAPDESPLRFLTIPEQGIFSSNTFKNNLKALDKDYSEKVQSIINLSLTEGFISDEYNVASFGKIMLDTSTSIQSVPKGQWQNNCDLYIWGGAVNDSKETIQGMYDGKNLAVYCSNPEKAIQKHKTVLDLSSCFNPNTDNPVVTSTNPSYIACELLGGKFSFKKYKTSIGYSPNKSKFFESLVFDDNTFNNQEKDRFSFQITERYHTHPVLDPEKTTVVSDDIYGGIIDNPTYIVMNKPEDYGDWNAQILQYNFENGERMLFQLTYFLNPADAVSYHMFSLSCGDYSGGWKCKESGTKVTPKHRNGAGSSSLEVSSPSGEISCFINLDGSYIKNYHVNTSQVYGYPILRTSSSLFLQPPGVDTYCRVKRTEGESLP